MCKMEEELHGKTKTCQKLLEKGGRRQRHCGVRFLIQHSCTVTHALLPVSECGEHKNDEHKQVKPSQQQVS